MKPTQAQLDIINANCKKNFTDTQVEVFKNLMIDTMPVLSHGIIISNDLMMKFNEDITKGVPQMMVHNTRLLPVGKVFEGELVQEQLDGQPVTSLYGSFYIPLDRPVVGFPELTTNDVCNMVDDGTLTDTSIGFSASKFTCTICGNDIRRYYDCPHMPGQDYIVEAADGSKSIQTCWGVADGNGGLHENSLVYSGACDRASLLSHDRNTENSSKETLFPINSIKYAPEDAVLNFRFSKAFGMEIYSNKPVKELVASTNEQLELTSLSKTQKTGDENMEDFKLFAEELQAKLTIVEDEKTALSTEFEASKVDLEAVKVELEAVKAELEASTAEATILGLKVTELEASIGELTSLAEIAHQYRESLQAKAIELGIKCHGNFFNVDRHTKFFTGMSIDELRETVLDYEKEAESKFTVGQLTQTGAEVSNESNTEFEEMTEDEKREFLSEEAKKYAASEEGKGVNFRTAFNIVREKYMKEAE